ncbi:MAG: GNAT family N-acetyltransferase [Gammaproteobacteria bacterium RIFCSPHIGHO2_12_FULL_37_14]|nr:MAG: GNAT family N-acetyltransferase [Gammaproteobacteria bacterium RIFCSPHIGHO2_12_FULL_37_14]
MKQDLKILRLKGQDTIPFIPELAKLRIDIFKSYPYLYDGNLDYEYNYLNTYVKCSESIIVIVLDHDNVVGASSAIPLESETIEFQKPFLENHINIRDVFYFGESVLQPKYRGHGIYRHFFAERETAAKEYGSKLVAFAAIERPLDDTKKPKDYVPLDSVWKHFGYEKHPELCMYYEWKEIGKAFQTPKPLIFWLKKL